MFLRKPPMPKPRRARLILPGLLGPISDPDAVARIATPLPDLAGLLRMATVDRSAVADGEGAFCHAFGIDGPPWPIAATARYGEADTPAQASGWWLRLDPVHLRVDSNHARLFGPHVLGLDADEAARLVERLNGHLAQDGLSIEAPAPARWYVRLAEAPRFTTHPLPEVAGRNVNPFLPQGPGADRLRGWLTELQMLLHDAPTNDARERAGRLPANSVWPWGESAVAAPTTAPVHVISAHPLACGLARLSSLAPQTDPVPPAEWRQGTTLIVDAAARDPLIHGEVEGWLEELARLERTWLTPLRRALDTGALDRIELEGGDGRRFIASRAARYRFWRRERPWYHWLAQGA